MKILGAPRDLVALGELLAKLRGRESLRDVQERTGVPRATLSRWENSGRIPLRAAALLDEAYGCRGELEKAIVHLRHPAWDPYGDGEPQHHHAHLWPAAHKGQVWIWIRPKTARLGTVYTIRLRWGPWRQQMNRTLGRDGVCLLTGKAREDVAVTCEVDLDPIGHVIFGTDDFVGPAVAESIRDFWVRGD